MSIFKILAYLNLAMFLGVMLMTKGDKRRVFIQYILLSFPILAIYIVPIMDGLDTCVYIFVILFYKKRKVSYPAGLIYWVFFSLLMISIIVGAVLSDNLNQGDYIQYAISVLTIFLFAKILIDECLEDPTFFYDVLSFLRTTLIVSFVFLCCQFVFGAEKFTLSKTINSNIVLSDAVRYPSFLSDPQVYAQFLGALSFLCFIKEPGQTKLPNKNYILIILSLVAMLTTGGRAGFLGWGAGLMLVVLFGNSRYRIAIVATCIVLYFVAYNFQDSFSIFKRSGDMEETYDFRYAIWQDAFQIFLQNPFFGIGLGNYSNYISLHNPDQVWVVDNEFVYFDHPESGYLKFLTELGASGFIAVFSLILIPLFRGFFLFVRSRDLSVILMSAAVLCWMVGFWSTYSFGDVRIKILIVTILCLLITSNNRIAAEQAALAETTEDAE
jgi:O-antigen ligase